MSASTTLWRRLLIYTHRWLGIAGSLLFVVWFVSGIVMMYAGMPSLTTEERLSHVAVLDLSRFKCGHDAPSYGLVDEIMKAGRTPRLIMHDIDANKPVGSIVIRTKTFAYSLELEGEKLEAVARSPRSTLLGRRAAILRAISLISGW